jgi:glutamate dehydrogenase
MTVDPARAAAALVRDLSEDFRRAAEEVVPWYLEQMPAVYFSDTSPEVQRSHLRQIIDARTANRPLDIAVRSADGRVITVFRSGNRTGLLADIIATLPYEPPLRAARIHSSADGSLVVDTFEFGDHSMFAPSEPAQAAKAAAFIAHAKAVAGGAREEDLHDFLRRCPADMVGGLTPVRLHNHMLLVKQVSGTDSLVSELQSEGDAAFSRINVAIANARTRTMFERVARVLGRYQISIQRAYVDVVKDPPHGSVSLLGFVVQHKGKALPRDSEAWQRALGDLRRLKWVDNRTFQLQLRRSELSLDRAEVLVAFAALVHQVLAPVNRFAFHRERVLAVFEEHYDLAGACVDFYLARFDPQTPLPDAASDRRAEELRARVSRLGDEQFTGLIFKTFVDVVVRTLRTNFFLPHRFGLALRLDPAVLQVGPKRTKPPYGTFFVHGREFNGFHVRFKEIARGGLRVVRPLSTDQLERESGRLYDEVYGLAYAQQLKNKDIPEGGAKAAILVEVPESVDRCVRAFIDCVLDLITPGSDVRALVVDRLGQQELLYVGPDENITPSHIEWIVARARRRGYPLPSAFMSSKPGAGINHKDYGVTSEGVNVFLRTALLDRGIDPTKQAFTVKLTGGPDGDVAGNMIRILDRDYGARARIVGIADASGVGEDPDGLDHGELLRLFHGGLPIVEFDRRRLGPKGRVVGVKEPNGIALRNTMHNRVTADAFVPGGGRPETVNEENWREFLRDDVPSSAIIVEGANLFLTPRAREELAARRVTVMKDSSANKCGVICSSYEICAAMLLSDEQFLAHKPRLVQEVLERLRETARREARLLLEEARRHPGTSLPKHSERLSNAINDAADAIDAAIRGWPEADRLLTYSVVRDHLPPVLFDLLGDSLFDRLPKPYLEWMIAKGLASRLVYREGIDFFAAMDHSTIGDTVLRYLRAERDMAPLVAEVRASGLRGAALIAEILERSGARARLFQG